MEWIYLVLIGLVILFGIAVLVVNRRRSARAIETRSAPPIAPPTRPPRPSAPTGTGVLEPEVLEPQVLEPQVLEPEVLEPEVVAPPATLRERMSRARSALAGAFAGVRGR